MSAVRSRVETEEHFLLDCAQLKDERTALYDAINSMVTADRAQRGDGRAFSVQQLHRDAQWLLLTGGMHGSISGEELRRDVRAAMLVAIARWTLERKETLAKVEKAARA